MSCDNNWLARPDVTAAFARLDIHYAVLGVDTRGGSRLDGFLKDIAPYQTTEAHETLRPAFEAVATKGGTSAALGALARGTWMTFLTPPQGLAEVIDSYGVTGKPVGRPGTFGRHWARHAGGVAWRIWVASRERTVPGGAGRPGLSAVRAGSARPLPSRAGDRGQYGGQCA
ncbi:hypothetical protein [Streptomyces sp. NPDC048650]|uniref:hypothetical protein n=1 Tax=unclassified Streptomyces TaxID=2593676 RepID=UPI003711A27C